MKSCLRWLCPPFIKKMCPFVETGIVCLMCFCFTSIVTLYYGVRLRQRRLIIEVLVIITKFEYGYGRRVEEWYVLVQTCLRASLGGIIRQWFMCGSPMVGAFPFQSRVHFSSYVPLKKKRKLITRQQHLHVAVLFFWSLPNCLQNGCNPGMHILGL